MPRHSRRSTALPSAADGVGYVPGTWAHWNNVEPDNVQQALDNTRRIVSDITPGGVLETITITDEGGLGISWSAGEIYDPAGNIVTIEAGNDTCTDDAINCLIWVSGTTLTLGTTPPDIVAGEVCCGSIACQNGDIWNVHEQPLIKERDPFSEASIAGSVPLVVQSGLLVSEDVDATNTHDVKSEAGIYHHDMHDIHSVAQIVSRTTNLVRWWRTAGAAAWSHDSNAEIDVTQYDQDGVGLSAAGAKYCRGLWLVSPTQIHYIYPQEAYNTEAQGVAGIIPTIPPGLALFPKSTTYVFKGGEAAMAALGTGRWADVRPQIGAPSLGGMITSHLSLTDIGTLTHAEIETAIGLRAIGPGASTDHAIARYDGAGGYTLQNSLVTIDDAGAFFTPSTISALGALHSLGNLGLGTPARLRFGIDTDYVDGDGAGTLTIAAGTALVASAAMTVSPTLTCPSLIGGTAANATLLLTASGHGTPSGDTIEFKTEGVVGMILSGDATPGASTNQLLIGNALPTDAAANELIIAGEEQYVTLAVYTSSTVAAQNSGFSLRRTRGTLASPTAVASGDRIGSLSFAGYDGSAFLTRANIQADTDGAVSANTVPTALIFRTGTTSAVESFRIQSDRHILLATTRQLRFGGATEYIVHDSGLELHSSDWTTLFAPYVRLDGTTADQFRIGGTTMVEVDANGMSFPAGGAPVPTIRSPSASNAFLGIGAGRRFSWNSTGIGFFAATPVAQASALTAQLTTITHTAPGTPDYAIQDLTNSGPYGFVTKDEGNTVLSTVANLQTRVAEIETKLQAYALLA